MMDKSKKTSPIYRVLSRDELEHLEEQFIFYLSSLGVDADAWKTIQKENITLRDEYIVHFSDMIYETTLSNITYLLKANKKNMQAIHVQSTGLSQVVITSQSAEIDIRQSDFDKKDAYKIMHFNKSLDIQNKNKVLFEMLEDGFKISDGQWYKKLCMLLAE